MIEWRFLRFRHNQHEEGLAREMARSLGVDLIEFFPGYAPPAATESEVQAADEPLQGLPIEGPALLDGTTRPTGMLGHLLRNDSISYGLPPASSHERKCDWHYFGTMIYPGGAVGPCCVSNDQQDDFASLDDAAGFTEAWNSPRFLAARASFAAGIPSGTVCDRCPMSAAQTYQFGQKLRGILRIAPPWVLKILDAAPESFFLDIGRLLMPGEVGAICSGRLAERFPELRGQPFEIPHLQTLDVPRPFKAMLAGWAREFRGTNGFV